MNILKTNCVKKIQKQCQLMILLAITLISTSLPGQTREQQRRADAYDQNKNTREAIKNSNNDAALSLAGAILSGIMINNANANSKKVDLGKCVFQNPKNEKKKQGIGECRYLNRNVKKGTWVAGKLRKGSLYIYSGSKFVKGYFTYGQEEIKRGLLYQPIFKKYIDIVGTVSSLKKDDKNEIIFYGEIKHYENNTNLTPNGFGVYRYKDGAIVKGFCGKWKNGKLTKKMKLKKVLKKIAKKEKKLDKRMKDNLAGKRRGFSFPISF
jgi:hypothetical protein